MIERTVRSTICIYSPGSDEIGADGECGQWAVGSGRAAQKARRILAGQVASVASPKGCKPPQPGCGGGDAQRHLVIGSHASSNDGGERELWPHARFPGDEVCEGQPSSTFPLQFALFYSTLVGDFRFSRWCVGVSEKEIRPSYQESASKALLFHLPIPRQAALVESGTLQAREHESDQVQEKVRLKIPIGIRDGTLHISAVIVLYHRAPLSTRGASPSQPACKSASS